MSYFLLQVSYILHRRQFGNKEINKEPISEETILIKKVGFFQKLATPLKYNLTDQQNRLTKPLNSSSTTELMQSDQTLETSAKNENDPLILNNKEDDKQLLEIVELDKSKSLAKSCSINQEDYLRPYLCCSNLFQFRTHNRSKRL